MRAPYNVLILPYSRIQGEIAYCIFKREDLDVWQFIAGGGEEGETPITAAKRESFEEANILETRQYKELESMCYVSVNNFSERARANWGEKYVIPVYSFAVELDSKDICISHEHTEYRWCTYEEASNLLHFDLDRTALYELNERIDNDKWNIRSNTSGLK
ncbi:MAG: NUDIX domain-containing protein [Clostridiales bacterium]|nr:NUDIX domain-containing protein [Clostridiales bacterium]